MSAQISVSADSHFDHEQIRAPVNAAAPRRRDAWPRVHDDVARLFRAGPPHVGACGSCAPSPRRGEGRGEGLSEPELKLRAPLTRLASLATLSPSGRGKECYFPCLGPLSRIT